MSWKRPDTYGRVSRSVIDTAFDATAVALAKRLLTVAAAGVPVVHYRAEKAKRWRPQWKVTRAREYHCAACQGLI
jgi:hypothetical protein